MTAELSDFRDETHPPLLQHVNVVDAQGGVDLIAGNSARKISLETCVEAVFSQPIDPSSVGATSIVVADAATGVPVAGNVTPNEAIVTWVPASLTTGQPLSPNADYMITISGTMKGAAGGQLGATRSFAFSTTTLDRFPGPRPYDEDQHFLFRGREREVERMLNATFDRLGVLSAESGAGKSSLLAAGYIPELRRLRATNAKRGTPPVLLLRAWGGRDTEAEDLILDGTKEAVKQLKARSKMWANLAPTLTDATLRMRAERIAESVGEDHRRLWAILDQLPAGSSMKEVLDELSREEGLILILDQFEEFMGSASADAGGDQRSAEKATKAVGRLFRDLPKLRILIALRTEYCRTLQRYLNFFVPNLDHRVIDLSPLPPQSIGDIVKGVCNSEREKIEAFAQEVAVASGATGKDDGSNVSVLEVQALLHGYDNWCMTRRGTSDFTLDLWNDYADSIREANDPRFGRVALKLWVKNQLELAITDSRRDAEALTGEERWSQRARWMLLPILPRLSTHGGYKQHLNLLDLFLDLADRLSEGWRPHGWGKSDTVRQCIEQWMATGARPQRMLDSLDLRRLMQEAAYDPKKSAEDKELDRENARKAAEKKRDDIQSCILHFNSVLTSLKKKGILKMSGRGKDELCELVHDGLSEHVRLWAQELPKSSDTVLGCPVEVVGERFAWGELGSEKERRHISNQKWLGCSLSRGAHITNVSFEGCEFNGLSLTDCILKNVVFENCTMPGAIMIGCTLTGVRFECCDLTSAAFLGCTFAEKIEFVGGLPMIGGNLGQIDALERQLTALREAQKGGLAGAPAELPMPRDNVKRERVNNLTGVDFARCTMQSKSSITFTQCLLRFAKIGKIKIEGSNQVNFEKCDMMNAWVEDAGLPSVNVDQYCRTIGLLSFRQPPEGWLSREES